MNDDLGRFYGYLPMIAYLGTYVLTCLVGATLLLGGVEPFQSLYRYFTGTAAPEFNLGQMHVAIGLLVGAPISVIVGYALGTVVRLPEMRLRLFEYKSPHSANLQLSFLVFSLSAMWAIFRLVNLMTLGDLHSWFDYAAWIKTRWHLFEGMGFFSFVNVYIFLPLAAVWCLLEAVTARKLRVLGWSAVVVSIIVALLLFQKKAAVVTILIITFSGGIFVTRSKGARLGRRVLLAGLGGATILYFILVVIPIYSETSQTIEQSELARQSDESASTTAVVPVDVRVPDIIADSRKSAILAYALLAPLTRTSAPSLYYPVVFPQQHPYYGLDLGQDILGIGEMPDDNRVIWKHMNPKIPGASAAPFQFVLYSQVGLVGALAGSLLAGFLMRWAWRLTLGPDITPIWSSLFGSMIMLSSVYIAIDSVRNTVVVSYGVGWGLLFLIVMRLFSSFRPEAFAHVSKASK